MLPTKSGYRCTTFLDRCLMIHFLLFSSGHESKTTQGGPKKQHKGAVNAKKRKREDTPAPKSFTTSKHPPTSGTTSTVPAGYVDLSRAIYSVIQRQENEAINPRLNHTTTTCSSWQPSELLADHRPSHSYPTTEHSHTYYSLPPPCATPESYHENPAMGTWEVNTPVTYNYIYGHDAHFSCDYSGNYLGSNFDDYQAVSCDGAAWNVVRY